MKKVIVVLISFLVFSCGNSDKVEISKEEYNKLKGVNQPKIFEQPDVEDGLIYIIEIDSCEYLYLEDDGAYNGGQTMTHKGNCKFCAKRNLKQK